MLLTDKNSIIDQIFASIPDLKEKVKGSSMLEMMVFLQARASFSILKLHLRRWPTKTPMFWSILKI
jgi:hypothetical protein